MKTLLWIALGLGVVAGLFLLAGELDSPRVTREPDYQSIIDKVLQDERPGIALRVITPKFEVYETRGYVDWENEIPLETDHLFRVASCTKTFIATLTLIQHFEGKLDLDDTITEYLPESITNRIQYADQITIRQLLTHTSGIFNTNDHPDYWAAQYGDPSKEWTDPEVLEFALDQPANFEPGTGYTYSNSDYLLAGLILDQVLGHHHSADIRSRILEPLGLSSTFYEQKELFDREMLSHGYFDFDGDGIAEDYYGLRIETGGAAGGLVSTAGDLATFISALATRRDFPNAGYREEFMQELLAIQPASGEPGQVGTGPGIAEYDYGYGPTYGHSGGMPGYVSLMVYFAAHDVTFALAWNGFDGGFADFGMVPALYEALIEETFSALGIKSTLAEETSADNVYKDPSGLFTMPLVGDWKPVETDGTYAMYAYSDLDFAMSLTTIEASDAEGDLPAAVESVGIDPASLTEDYRGAWNKWSIFYYVAADGEGVTVLGQVQDGIGYYVIATGDPDLTGNPPEDVMKTLGGFALAGEIVLPVTVAEFETYVNEIVGLQPPALSIAIATADDLLYAQGFGLADGPEGRPARTDTVYFWGSITKTVTATAIMQLREQGLVDLDAPVADYLDYFPGQYSITVRQLLTHSSGLPEPSDWLPKHLRLEGQPLPDFDAMDRDYYAELEELMFEPGTTSAYANPNFVTLGQIVEAVSGQPYVEYVREHILIPLGMVTTDFEYSSETMLAAAAAPATSLSNREAIITILDDARGLGDAAGFFRESDENTAWMSHFIVGESAGGGLMGPATDMARYGQMLLNGGELDGVRILSSESIELLRQDQVSTTGEPLGFGMAWWIRDAAEHPYIEHGGGGEGVDALLRVYLDDGFAIALQANSGGYSRQEVMNAAANVVITMLGGGAPQEQPSGAVTPPIVDADGNVIPGSIAAIETVTLGGIEQTITIRGADIRMPVLLFLHGGPGVPSSPWATWNNVHADLEKNFVFVHWDQRGAGKSYSDDLTADDMHVGNLVSDALELTDILRERFNQDKIFLWGHSWGAGLGFETLRANSEPYYAFIASAVRPDWNSTMEMGYEKVLGLAYRAQDAEAIQALESIQPFDSFNLEHLGIRGQFLSQYLVGDFHTAGLEDAWLEYVFSDSSPEYPASTIEQTMAGMEFTDRTIGLEVMISGYDLFADFPVSTIPVYFLQGRYDYQCPGELAEIYYSALRAPMKDFVWFEDSAHDVYYDEPDKLNQELIRIASEVLAAMPAGPQPSVDHEAAVALQGLVDQQVAEQGILGMAMAARLADGTLISKASGTTDPEGLVAWNIDTVTAAGSITKTFTAVLIMQLVEEGKLSLDQTIEGWFPAQQRGDEITIRMLLSHTSGIANYISGENVMNGKWNREWTPDELISEAQSLGFVGEPGSEDAHYSNTGYIMLGLIIEGVTGNSWEDEIATRIVAPLGMHSTTFLGLEGVLDTMIGGYAITEEGFANALLEPWYPHASTTWSAGEIVTTVLDLVTFASALFDGDLVSTESLAEMATPMGFEAASGRAWGFGGAVIAEEGLVAFGMGGDIPGFHAFFIGVLDTDLVVVAACNTEEGDVITPSFGALEYIMGAAAE